MAKAAKWGAAIGSDEKWRFSVGDIVRVDYKSVHPECTRAGAVITDDDGHADLLCEVATCVVVARVPNPPDMMFKLLYADGSEAPPDAKCKCYVVFVIPEPDIQVAGFMRRKLGKFYIARDSRLSQTAEEKRLAELGLWNNESGVFDRSGLSELRSRVQMDKMNEKAGSHVDDR